MAEWIAKAALFNGAVFPATISPSSLTKTKSDIFNRLNDKPKGFTQKHSGYSGSRQVMCPATPSEKPNFPKMR